MFPRPRLPVLLLVAAVLVSASPAAGQEEPEAAPPRDLRPPVAAYTVVDGARVPEPLGGRAGDAARGEALFSDLETGGCTACHAAPGHPRAEAAPRILRDRLPDLPPPEPAPAADDHGDLEPDALDGEAGNDSDSALAPEEVAILPPPRPAPEAAGDAEAEAEAEEEPRRPPLLPLLPGPDLAGVAERLEEGRLRLWVVNPRIAAPQSRMPAYHDVSIALARRNPELRQPWLTPQEVEDVVAYLLTLREGAAGGHEDVTQGDDPPR